MWRTMGWLALALTVCLGMAEFPAATQIVRDHDVQNLRSIHGARLGIKAELPVRR